MQAATSIGECPPQPQRLLVPGPGGGPSTAYLIDNAEVAEHDRVHGLIPLLLADGLEQPQLLQEARLPLVDCAAEEARRPDQTKASRPLGQRPGAVGLLQGGLPLLDRELQVPQVEVDVRQPDQRLDSIGRLALEGGANVLSRALEIPLDKPKLRAEQLDLLVGAKPRQQRLSVVPPAQND